MYPIKDNQLERWIPRGLNSPNDPESQNFLEPIRKTQFVPNPPNLSGKSLKASKGKEVNQEP